MQLVGTMRSGRVHATRLSYCKEEWMYYLLSFLVTWQVCSEVAVETWPQVSLRMEQMEICDML